MSRRGFLGVAHPLADVARRRCRAEHGFPRTMLVGQVACGQCWEYVIRADEQVVVEHGLPRELVPDPDLVDEIAVELACRGERVELTPVELKVAAVTLAGRGLKCGPIADRLHISYGAARAVLAQLAHECAWPDLGEVGLTSQCEHGCKVMRCRVCDTESVSHRAAYGCTTAAAGPTFVDGVAA